MFNSIEVATKDVKEIVKGSFPTYNKRKVFVRATTAVTITDLNWSGGTRSEYVATDLEGKRLGSLEKFNHIAPWENPAEGVELPVLEGTVVVRGGWFCGKESTLVIHVNPKDMPKYIAKEKK